MWYNGVPAPTFGSTKLFALIVWKDYSCQEWKYIGYGTMDSSSFTADQKNAITYQIREMTLSKLLNDVWGTAHDMMENLRLNSLFSVGGYSVVLSQDYQAIMFGYVCKVGENFYQSINEYQGPLVNLAGTMAGSF